MKLVLIELSFMYYQWIYKISNSIICSSIIVPLFFEITISMRPIILELNVE